MGTRGQCIECGAMPGKIHGKACDHSGERNIVEPTTDQLKRTLLELVRGCKNQGYVPPAFTDGVALLYQSGYIDSTDVSRLTDHYDHVAEKIV